MARLVVRGDCNVDILEGRVSVAESNDRNGDFGTLLQRLMVGSRVCCNNKAWLRQVSKCDQRQKWGRESDLFEGARVVIGECTRGEPSSNSTGSDMSSKLQDCSLSIGPGTDDDDISGILDRGDDTGGKNEFLPGLANVDDVDTIRTSFPNI
jgi:hypothetical protein